MIITTPIEELLEKQLEMLGHNLIPTHFTEVRVIRPKGFPTQEFCSNFQEFNDECQKYLQSGSLYVGINPRRVRSGYATDVSHVTCLCIDIDPVRPKDTASTDQQHSESVELGKKISQDLQGYAVSSGSGCHVYFPIEPVEVTNVEGITASIKKFIDEIRAKYGTATLKIDPIFDLPRVIRVWGSLNGKSNRLCVPLTDIGRITRRKLELSQIPPTTATKTESTATKEGTEARFEALLRVNKRLKEIVDGSASFESRSESDYVFVSILHKARFTAPEIESLFPRNTTGNKEAKKGDVNRIISKLPVEPIPNTFSFQHDMERYKQSLKERRMGIRTGFPQLDEMISGLQRGKLYILPAARPNKGKTTLLTQILMNIAEDGHVCLFFPTEVGHAPIADKMIAQKTGVYLKKFQNGTFTEEDTKKIEAATPSLAKLPLIIREGMRLTPQSIKEGVDEFAPTVLCIDYFQNFSWDDPESVGEKNDAVRFLKQLAIDYNIPVIITSQLNRSEKYDMSSLKGCGGLEELGDVIGFLVPEDKAAHPQPVNLTIVKSKYSSTGTVKFLFNKTIGKFEEIEATDE